MSPVSRSFSTVLRIINCFLPISLEVIQKTFTICEWFPCLIFVRIMVGVPAMPACGMGHLSVYPTRFWASLPLDERLPGKVKESLFRRGVYHTLCSWRWETSQLSDDVWDMATVDAHGMFYQQHPSVWRMYSPIGFLPWECMRPGSGVLYNHISVGFALLVRHHRAMRRPLSVERVAGANLHAWTEHHSTFFWLSNYTFNILCNLIPQSSRLKRNHINNLHHYMSHRYLVIRVL